MSYVLYMTSPNTVDPILFERMLQTAVSASALDALCQEHGWKVRPRNLQLGRGDLVDDLPAVE
jgi:hypothetical protein